MVAKIEKKIGRKRIRTRRSCGVLHTFKPVQVLAAESARSCQYASEPPGSFSFPMGSVVEQAVYEASGRGLAELRGIGGSWAGGECWDEKLRRRCLPVQGKCAVSQHQPNFYKARRVHEGQERMRGGRLISSMLFIRRESVVIKASLLSETS